MLGKIKDSSQMLQQQLDEKKVRAFEECLSNYVLNRIGVVYYQPSTLEGMLCDAK